MTSKPSGWMRRWGPWLALLALSLTLHLWGLGERAYHHDEAIHAHSSFNLLNNGIYRYDPTYHGPLLYYLVVAAYASPFGDTDFSARLPVALSGVLLVVVAWCLRRPLGARAAWWTGLLATLSPITLYYGRFLRMDVLEMLCASAAAVAAWRAAKGSDAAWAWFGVFVGLAFATKENAYVTCALVVGVWGLIALASDPRRSVPATFAWLGRHRWGILTAVAMSAIVVIPLFTVGFTYPEDWFFPKKAISYWWGQHSVQRVAGPPWFHLPRLAAYEFLPIIAALTWAARRGRRMRTVEVSLFLFALASVCMYAYLGEKVPWLGVHQVWAFLPLAGLQLARTFGPRGSLWGRGLAAVGLAATAAVSLSANFVNDEISPALDRTEMIIYVQTCPELVDVVREGDALAAEGHDTVAAVSGTAGWPLTWYWRSTPTRWSEPPPDLRPPLVICDAEDEDRFRKLLGPRYRADRIPLRAWWVLDTAKATPASVLRWLLTRTPFNDVGSTDVTVFRRSDEIPATAVEVPVADNLAGALGVTDARVVGEGWLTDPRGIAFGDDGRLAVADVGLDLVVLFDTEGRRLDDGLGESMDRPESVAWAPGGILVVADTWSHRVLLYRPGDPTVSILPAPEGGWYGPRGVAVAPDGSIAVTDTGNKRVALFSPGAGRDFAVSVFGGDGSEPGRFAEPGGLVWFDNDRLAVCDTANHRVQILDREGTPLEVIDLAGAWADFYSRPQITVLDDGRLLASDTPASSLWLIDGGESLRIDLSAAGIAPTGVAYRDGKVYLADTTGRIWILTLR